MADVWYFLYDEKPVKVAHWVIQSLIEFLRALHFCEQNFNESFMQSNFNGFDNYVFTAIDISLKLMLNSCM